MTSAARRRDVQPPPPTCLYIEVTNRCNLKCVTCIRTFETREEAKDLSFDEVRSVVDQLPSLDRAVLHGIGEPLLNRELPRMIEYLKARGVYVLFNTNAVLLTPEWQACLIETELDELRVSMDAATEEKYEQIRGFPVLHRLVANLKELHALKQRRGASRPLVSLWLMGLKESIHEMPAFFGIAKEVGADEVYLQRLVYADGGPAGSVMHREHSLHGAEDGQVDEVLQVCEELSRQHGFALHASGATTPRRSLGAAENPYPWQACQRPFTLMYMTATGNILPCCIAPFAVALHEYPEIILGNVREQSLEEIWHSERYQTFRRQLLSPEPATPCRGCGVEWSL
ncbi:MAG: radical SAM/SPASM domain-containing protein [Nitrospinota bacterium]